MKTKIRGSGVQQSALFRGFCLDSFYRDKKQRLLKKSSEQGLTLMEALVGILIITIVLSASAPPILLAAATRIQNSRAEKAIQIAQGEIDRVRLLMEQGNYVNADLPPEDGSIADPDDIQEADPPTSSCLKPCTPSSITQAVEQKLYEEPFLVQTFREPGVRELEIGSDPDGNNQVIAFRMGVRVYSRAAISTLEDGGTLEGDKAALQITSGLGEQSQKPLAVLYADLVRGDMSLSLEGYRRFLRD
jgi:type II secretory pathway pseudopilin PulG